MAQPKPSSPLLNPTHSFALTAVAILALAEGTGQPAIIQGPHGGGTPVTGPVTTFWDGATPGTWITNSEGAGLRFGVLTSPLRLGASAGASSAWVPTGDMTLLIVRGKTTGVLNERFFRAGSSSGSFDIYLPYSDGVLYFDYGGTSAPNRLTKSGLTYSTSVIDYWAFTAGAAGSAIWQNGVKQASQATGISRSGNTPPYLGYAPESQDVNFLQINDSQWDDATIAAWFLDPYAHLITAPTRRYLPALGVG